MKKLLVAIAALVAASSNLDAMKGRTGGAGLLRKAGLSVPQEAPTACVAAAAEASKAGESTQERAALYGALFDQGGARFKTIESALKALYKKYAKDDNDKIYFALLFNKLGEHSKAPTAASKALLQSEYRTILAALDTRNAGQNFALILQDRLDPNTWFNDFTKSKLQKAVAGPSSNWLETVEHVATVKTGGQDALGKLGLHGITPAVILHHPAEAIRGYVSGEMLELAQ